MKKSFFLVILLGIHCLAAMSMDNQAISTNSLRIYADLIDYLDNKKSLDDMNKKSFAGPCTTEIEAALIWPGSSRGCVLDITIADGNKKFAEKLISSLLPYRPELKDFLANHCVGGNNIFGLIGEEAPLGKSAQTQTPANTQTPNNGRCGSHKIYPKRHLT